MMFSKKSRSITFYFVVVLPVFLICVSSISARSERGHHDLMPVPNSISFVQGKLYVDAGFRVALTGYSEPRLQRAVDRLIRRLTIQTGIPFFPGNGEKNLEPSLVVQCSGPGEKIQSVREDESYTLDINPARAELVASTPVGILRGIETFLQLIKLDEVGFYVPAVHIEDEPRYPWRGLLIDVCRHWMPAEVIKRNLDGMAAVKLNVLHWHLSEDQGFRVECRSFPKLHQVGSDGNYYTQEQIQEILEYAKDRGIRVVPEFDMPGHTTSWLVGYPELASVPGPYQIERQWGVIDSCMDPTKEELYEFLDTFLEEMTALFPDAYFHIGGDEVNGNHWNKNPDITAFKRKHRMKDNHDLQVYFNRRVQTILGKNRKKMIGWDEIFHPDLPKDVVVQSWRGPEALAAIAREGYMGILSNGYYLDYILSASEHYAVDPLGRDAAALNSKKKGLILGGEACMWAEFVNPETIDSRIWPRTAAIAERLWSPSHINDLEDMYRRLDILDGRLDLLGLNHNLNPSMMLQRLAGKNPIHPLRVLAEIVEPVKNYTRPNTREYTQMTPLNRLVDAAKPESHPARKFENLVDEMLLNAPRISKNRFDIEDRLKEWRDNHVLLLPILESSYLLKEIIPLSQDVKDLADVGLRALKYLEHQQSPPKEWLKHVKKLLERPKKPESELIIQIIPAIQKLFEAAASLEETS
ncbi:MAG: family 20 glycosylhydrolase [Candidatus Aminicenantaceae bacterium]